MLQKPHQSLVCQCNHNKKKPSRFQNSCTFEKGLSNLHKIILTVLKLSFLNINILNYHNYEFLINTLFRGHVLSKLSDSNLQRSDKDLIFYANVLAYFKHICSIEKHVYTIKSGTLYK